MKRHKLSYMAIDRSLCVRRSLCVGLLGLAIYLMGPGVGPQSAMAQWRPAKRVLHGALREKKLALLIGISQFQHQHWAPLTYANNDVNKMTDVLRKYGQFDRIMVRNSAQETTKASLVRALKELKQQVKVSQDTVVVYISSHGTISSPAGQSQRKRYIITSDTTERISQTALAVEELKELLQTFRSRRIVLILATCYTYTPNSKSVRNPGMKGAITPTRPLKSRAMQILSAAAQSQPAFESSLLRSDVYTHFFADCAAKLMKKKRGPITAIDLHICALTPTREFVKKHKGTNQVPVVYAARNANVDVVLLTPTRRPRRLGYFQARGTDTAQARYRITRWGQKSTSPLIVSQGDITALPPGRYRVQLEDAQGRTMQTQLIEIAPDHVTPWKSEWVLETQGGVMLSQTGGSSWLGGGSLGLHHRFFGLKLGVWSTHKNYLQSAPSQQLYLELRAEGGYRHQWGMFELFVGGYLGLGLMLKHVAHPTQPTGSATVFVYGATIAPCLWIRPSWGIALQADAGFSLLQLDGLAHLFAATLKMGVHYRF